MADMVDMERMSVASRPRPGRGALALRPEPALTALMVMAALAMAVLLALSSPAAAQTAAAPGEGAAAASSEASPVPAGSQPPAAASAAAPAATAPAGEAEAKPGADGIAEVDLVPDPAPVASPAPESAPTRPLESKAPGLPGLLPPGLSLVKFIGAFIVVLVLLLVCLRVIGWLSRGGRLSKSGRAFTMRGTMSLDSRRYLAAVEIDGHLLVVGVSHDRLTGLASWPLDDDFRDGPILGAPGREAEFGAPAPSPKRPAPRTPAPAPAPEAGKAPGPERVSTAKSGRDAPDFTLTLEEDPYDGPRTGADELHKLDLDGDD